MISFTGIPAEHVQGVYSAAWGLLKPAAARVGLYTRQSVLESLQSGHWQLWAAFSNDRMVMACVTEIATYPGKKHGAILLCGGEDMAEWLGFIAVIEAWMRANGCPDSYINCRPGWQRKLPGYRLDSVILVKDLAATAAGAA